ncbi:MAG: hypothetical protein KDB69_05955 [Acidimicrobiia bacterium]|nr:hypothetical protein [Acidimicrobiia bacterium]
MVHGTTITAGSLKSSTATRRITIEVRENTPFLPKVAFVVISFASLAGVAFTSRHLGVTGWEMPYRWLTLWVWGLVLGFESWRVVYLRRRERGLHPTPTGRYVAASVDRARTVERFLGIGLVVIAPAPWVFGYVGSPGTAWVLTVVSVLSSALLIAGPACRHTRMVVLGSALIAALAWGAASTGGFRGVDTAVRVLHLAAFGLWLGGALWNLSVAVPTGRAHPNFDAVVAGARQLQRFRWVVRFALPTIILTGLIQADVYRHLPVSWWTTFPGVLIPIKVGLIIALIVIFITCPLYRQCSPVAGVCNIDDVDDGADT